MRGKLIVIEGTDCSGKETQSKKLVERLNNEGQKAVRFTFPNYDSPTGKIVGGPFLGKEEIMESFFPEKAPNVNGKVSSLYYAADRFYNMPLIEEKLNEGYSVIVDRYTQSNMAFQGCKISSLAERREMYHFIDTLEFELLHLPRPDAVFLLYMPLEAAKILKKNRVNLDDNEKDDSYLKQAEDAYLELAELYGYNIIECTDKDKILSIEEIHEKVYEEFSKIAEKRKVR